MGTHDLQDAHNAVGVIYQKMREVNEKIILDRIILILIHDRYKYLLEIHMKIVLIY